MRWEGTFLNMHVLLVENDNLDKTKSLISNLEGQGHDVCLVHTPENATKQATVLWPNLVVFHPGHEPLDMAGFQAAIAETRLDIPHIFVGQKNQLAHEISANTILVAPDKLQQLTQSIQKATAKQKNRFLRFPDLVVDCNHLNVLRNGKSYSLTPKEFKLLHLLVTHHDEVLSRKLIMQKVWETDYMGDTRTLDVHIRWLREKIEKYPSRPRRLITIRGLGYRFIVNPDTD